MNAAVSSSGSMRTSSVAFASDGITFTDIPWMMFGDTDVRSMEAYAAHDSEILVGRRQAGTAALQQRAETGRFLASRSPRDA